MQCHGLIKLIGGVIMNNIYYMHAITEFIEIFTRISILFFL